MQVTMAASSAATGVAAIIWVACIVGFIYGFLEEDGQMMWLFAIVGLGTLAIGIASES